MKKIFALLSTLLLVGCSGAPSTSTMTSDTTLGSSDSISSDDVSSDSTLSTIEITDGLEFNEGVKNGFGVFSDIEINILLREDHTYVDTLELTTGTISKIMTSDESILKIEKQAGTKKSYNVITGVPGDALVTIYNQDEEMVYRKIVRVRKHYEENEIGEALFNQESYSCLKLMGSFKVTFIQTEPLQCILKGSDDMETGLNFTLELSNPVYRESDSQYIFDLETVEDNSENQTQTKLTKMLVSSTGDQIHVYYESLIDGQYQDVLFAWCMAKEYLYLHNGNF